MRAFKIPIWYFMLFAAVSAALVYFGMIRPYIPLSEGAPVSASLTDMNPNIGGKIPPMRFYASLWDDTDFAMGLCFLFLGLMCLVFGIIRLSCKLGGKQIFLVSAFVLLFAFMTLSMTGFAASHFSDEYLFYLFWFTFFGYPIALFLLFFNCLRIVPRRWLWMPVLVAGVYAAAAFVMYFVFGLPFDIPERLYTYISIAAAVIYLCAGTVFAKESEIRYMRGIFIIAVVLGLRLLIMARQGIYFSVHNEYKTFLLVIAAFMVCYILLANTRELVRYRTNVRSLEVKNAFMLENYNALEKHMAQIAELKHEMRHHFFAVRELFDGGDYERLTQYLNDMQGNLAKTEESIACDNRIIQAVLGHAAGRARELGFEIEFEILPLPPLSVSDADLVSLFMNLMDNAIESSARIPNAGDRFIKVQLKTRLPYFCLSVKNAYTGQTRKDGDSYISVKDDSLMHGYGLEVIKKITKKYDGLASFEQTENVFCAKIALPY